MVDVGGGLGHVSLIVARENPAVHVAIEDRDALRAESKEVSVFFHFLHRYLSPFDITSTGTRTYLLMSNRGSTTS